MSFKQITITTAEGIALQLSVQRTVRNESIRKGFLVQKIGRTIKNIIVQYGAGIAGQGATLTLAMCDFQGKWSNFCANRQA